MTARTPSPEYLETLLVYYEEEIIGEAYFRMYAERLSDPHQARRMRLMGDVERHAANAIVPLLTRHGLTPRLEKALLAEGRAQAETALVDWDRALAEMRRTFPGYVADFEALEAMAPAQDLRALQFLSEHERATIAFLELELSNPQVSMEPLTIYLNNSVDSLEQVDRK